MKRKRIWGIAALIVLLFSTLFPMLSVGVQGTDTVSVETTASSEQVLEPEVQPPEQTTEPSQPAATVPPVEQSEEPQANAPPQVTEEGQEAAANSATATVNQTGKVVVRLLDEENNQLRLGNGAFQLTEVSGKYVSIGWTDLNRDLVYDNVPFGTYILEQTDSPIGYQHSGFKVTFEIKEEAALIEYTVTNMKESTAVPVGEIHVISVDDADPAKRLAGACYQLENTATGEIFLDKTAPTDSNGKLVIKNVPAGHYRLTKNGSPEGYTGPTVSFSFPLTLKQIEENDFPTYTFKYTKRTDVGYAAIEYLAAGETTPLAGGEFTLYDAAGNVLEKKKTEQGELLYFRELRPGQRYRIKQTKAPAGYEESTEEQPLFDESFDVTYQALAFRFRVYNKKLSSKSDGKVRVQLYAEGDEKSTIGGAEFSLYDEKGKLVARKVTVAGEDLLFEDLDFGAYTLRETKIPEGYEKQDIQKAFRIDTTAKEIVVKLTNKKLSEQKNTTITGKARDKSTDANEGYAQKNSTIMEEVSYHNAEVGREYTIKTVLMDPLTSQPLLINGVEIHMDKTFTAKKPNGSIDVAISFDSSSLAGKKAVVFVSLTQAAEEAAKHAMINDPNQTITYPAITTKAAGQVAGEKIQIKDTITYDQLVAGQKYTVKGQLMDQTTGLPYQIDGKSVVSEAIFTAETSGIAEVIFEFPTRTLTKRITLVVFEQLFNSNGSLVASHQELSDTNQTVTFDPTKSSDQLNTGSIPSATPSITPEKTTVNHAVEWRYSRQRKQNKAADSTKILPKTGSKQNVLGSMIGFLVVLGGLMIVLRRMKETNI
ncbi:VaFE repeat-containing surface-anchored protein [Enterococcus sp. DIV0187]|uniref:VaFE repeat-containing surface-anchored protein n=1 Tax=Enterococcus sp. DIV0187 TaxID=2774644 RepID=UPI003F2748EE